MFGFGFLEIVAIAILALIVLGPNRFPSFIKDVLRLLNQTRSLASNVQKEIKNLENDIQQVVEEIPNAFSEETPRKASASLHEDSHSEETKNKNNNEK